MSRWSLISVTAVLIILAACSSRSEGPPAIGEAYAGPATLNIRKELPLQSPVVAMVKHGDRLDIIQTRRRFVQVRTAQGVMGWTDGRLLLTPDQMRDLQSFTEATQSLPSQGSATVYEPLNVHTEPSRTSPSFVQIPENGSVQVIGHKVAARTSARTSPPPPLVAPPKGSRSSKKRDREKEKRTSRAPLPPMPAAPKPPDNWQQLSQPTLQALAAEPRAEDAGKAPDAVAPKPVVMEDWSLVRTKDGKSGWVLSRMLSMSIPDEVAQYAEGQRITSYFPLADIRDEGQTKHVWLWTTMSRGAQEFEFDGFRVFVWSLKRHRYETVYRGRDVQGYYPVSATKGSGERGEGATFSLILEEDGKRVRNTYVFNGYRVNLQRSDPYNPAQQTSEVASTAQSAGPAPPAARTSPPPWYKRFSNRVRAFFR